MKKHIFIVCLVLFSLVSCTDENLVNAPNSLRIVGGIDNSSRAAFVEQDDKIRTHWEVKDRIGLFTDEQSNLSYCAKGEGQNVEFVWTGFGDKLKYEEGMKVRAYYPHWNYMAGDNKVQVDRTASQSSDSFVPMLLYGEGSIVGNELNLVFKHYFAYLKLTVKASDFREFVSDDDLQRWKSDNSVPEAAIRCVSSAPVGASYFDMETYSFVVSEDKEIYFRCCDMEIESDDSYTYYIAILPQPEEANIKVSLEYGVRNNSLSEVLFAKFTPKKGLKAGHVYSVNSSDAVLVEEEQFEALKAFYHATGGEQWECNDNWLSDKMLHEWFGVNSLGNINHSYVVRLSLEGNNLKGSLPEEFTTLMDYGERLYLNDNLLVGDIPDGVKNHPNWNNLGWYIVDQDQWNGGGFDLINSNLYTENVTVTNFLDGSQKELYELFSNNELTQVMTITSKDEIPIMFNNAKVNSFLDFQNKGLGTVLFINETNEAYIKDIQTFVETQFAELDNIYFVNGYHRKYYQNYIYDKLGQLTYIGQYKLDDEKGLELVDNSVILKKESEFLSSYLGAPDTSHPKFAYNYYTSTDYSKDGEVFTIQKATEGKGIDIVLMGDAFVDKDMGAGGLYERKMQEATEIIFKLEPYRSLRNRFNVYGVKVVSPNAEFASDAIRRINEDDRIALQYAANTTAEYPLVAVIYNAQTGLIRSHCTNYKDYSCVAYMMDPIGEDDWVDNTLIHELCGHGIAWLSDEYVESYNQNVVFNGYTEIMDNAAKKAWGIGMNVDYNNTEATVRWAHLLADERFQNEDIGIYEGADHIGYGLYRPSDNSMMNSNIGWFNAPSREIIYKAIMTRSEGDGWKYDYEEFVAFDEVSRKNSVSARSLSRRLSDEEKQEIQERHNSPTFINSTWRDVIKNSKQSKTVVPLR